MTAHDSSLETPTVVEPAETQPTPLVDPVETPDPLHTATANLTRLVSIAVAGAAAIFGLLSIPMFMAQAWHPSPALAAAAWAASFGLPVTLGLSAKWGTSASAGPSSPPRRSASS